MHYEIAFDPTVYNTSTFQEGFPRLSKNFVPTTYSDTLEYEPLHLAKLPHESVSLLFDRMSNMLRMFAQILNRSLVLDDFSKVRLFKRAMPSQWQENLEITGKELATMCDALMYFESQKLASAQFQHH